MKLKIIMFISLQSQLLSHVEVGCWMVKAWCWDQGDDEFKPHQQHCLP